jgi:hypothetical protein
MSDHPPSHRLEALAAGDSETEAEAHVAECAECRDYVSALREELGTWKESAERERGLAHLNEAAPERAPAGATVHVLRLATVAAAPLLIAAAILLFIRRAPPSPPSISVSSACSNCPLPPSDFGTRFKGAPEVAVIVEHAGRQHRYTRRVVVSAGDRLRVEVSVPSSTPLAAGILTADHQYVPLFLPEELDAGTHFSEKAARFDAEPTRGWVIVGSPDAVRAAEESGIPSGVVALPLSYTRQP